MRALQPPWWRAAGAARHARDREIIAGQQSAMEFVEQADLLTLTGDYVVLDEHHAPERFPVTVVFPPDYPASEPLPLLDGDRFVRDVHHHFYSGRPSVMCLWLPTASLWSRRDPDGLQTFLDQVTLFLDRQLIMEADPSLPYPGPEWPHGYEAYLQFLEADLGVSRAILSRLAPGLIGQQNPRAPCPCGSAKQFRRCHQPGIDRFRSRFDREDLRRLAELLSSARPASR